MDRPRIDTIRAAVLRVTAAKDREGRITRTEPFFDDVQRYPGTIEAGFGDCPRCGLSAVPLYKAFYWDKACWKCARRQAR